MVLHLGFILHSLKILAFVRWVYGATENQNNAVQAQAADTPSTQALMEFAKLKSKF